MALSGEGGDELFGGYSRYWLAKAAWGGLAALPRSIRQLAARIIRTAPDRFKPDQLHKASLVLGAKDSDTFYRSLLSHWQTPDEIALGGKEPQNVLWDESVRESIPNFIERMQFLDLVTYLPDDILTKIDRASMAFGLEVRVPLLDHRLVEFAFRLPPQLKRRGRSRKWLRRQVLYRYVPQSLVDRPKAGFNVPIGAWLRGPLRDWAEGLLAEENLRSSGLLDPLPVRRFWHQHVSGQRNWHRPLWTVLMLELWRSHYRTERLPAPARAV